MTSMQALQSDGWLGRWVAVLVALLFVQGLLSGFVHFEAESHHYCVQHERVTHDREHARQARHDQQSSVAEMSPERDDFPTEQDKKDHRQSDDCLWLTWVQKTSHASPDLAPHQLNLPPPAPDLHALPARQDRSLRPPISIGHISPINSPPSA